MKFGHEKLDVYRVALHYVAWAYELAKKLDGANRYARDQLLRASQSIPQNIAEGNGRGTVSDRRRFFEIARGSALECASIQDILEICKILSEEESAEGKDLLYRVVSMLTMLGKRDYSAREEPAEYYRDDEDKDNDSDNDDDDDNDKD
ncbi:MAG: four helix bundle protein [Candidatus Rifleibacterium amylolyticum]|nr:MAG: four helix bundle protein [Candidatus Rifleibacterium amylolyticum]